MYRYQKRRKGIQNMIVESIYLSYSAYVNGKLKRTNEQNDESLLLLN